MGDNGKCADQQRLPGVCCDDQPSWECRKCFKDDDKQNCLNKNDQTRETCKISKCTGTVINCNDNNNRIVRKDLSTTDVGSSLKTFYVNSGIQPISEDVKFVLIETAKYCVDIAGSRINWNVGHTLDSCKALCISTK